MKETNAQKLKRLRADAVKRGLCYVCRCRFPRPGVRNCDECLSKSWDRQKRGKGLESSRRRTRASSERRRAKRSAAGLCPGCGRRPPVTGYSMCSVCLDETASRVLAHHRAKGAKPSGRRCSVCGSPSHFANRHDRPGVLP